MEKPKYENLDEKKSIQLRHISNTTKHRAKKGFALCPFHLSLYKNLKHLVIKKCIKDGKENTITNDHMRNVFT